MEATTVAATMIIAAMAGVKIFATGGIGGVHRGETTMDISADLEETGSIQMWQLYVRCQVHFRPWPNFRVLRN